MTTATAPRTATSHRERGRARGRRTVSVRAVVFVAVALAALYLAYWRIGEQNPYTDEVTYMRAGWEYLHGIATANLEHPPTAKYLYGLSQYVVGRGVLGPRIVASTASLGVGVVLLLWLRRPLGWWGAQLAAALWWLSPRGDSATWMHVASGSAARIDRIGLLEPVMTAFGVIAVAAAWQWAASAGSRSRDPARHGTGRVGGPTAGWPWMALAGAALAASVTSKVTTAVLVVALVAVPLLFRRWLGMLVAAVVAAVSFAIVFVLVYLPVGGLGAIEYMLRFQGAHNTDGHEISVLGATYTRAPWWSNGVYLAQGVGWPFLVVVVIGVLAAVVLRPDRLVALLGIAAAALMAFSAVAHVALPHYYIVWMPFLVAFAAVGYTRLARLRPPWTLVLAAVLVAPTAFSSAQLAVAVAEARPAGLARLGTELRAHGVPDGGRLLFAGVRRPTFDVWFRGRGIMQYVTVGTYGALVEGRDARFPLTDELRALVREHPEAFDEFRVDDLRVWVPKDGREIEKRGADAVLVG